MVQAKKITPSTKELPSQQTSEISNQANEGSIQHQDEEKKGLLETDSSPTGKSTTWSEGNYQSNSSANMNAKQCRIVLNTQKYTLASCYLKTKNKRFKEFILSLEDQMINFSRHYKDTGELQVRH